MRPETAWLEDNRSKLVLEANQHRHSFLLVAAMDGAQGGLAAGVKQSLLAKNGAVQGERLADATAFIITDDPT